MRIWGWFSVGALAISLVGACAPPVNLAGDSLKGATTGQAFEGVQCSAVRPQTEPDLMAWDPGSRANLNRLRRRGVVAVRYQAKGCNVELELLSNCIGATGKYEFSPYSANEHKVAHNDSELFAQLPVGAARLSGSLKGNRALRTDYMLAGQYALPPDATFRASDLRGSDCARATHVVSAVYVGAFAMGAGEARLMAGSGTLFGAAAGGKSSADVEVISNEGDAEACAASQKDSKESERCAVPLRIGLQALDMAVAPVNVAAPPPAVVTNPPPSTAAASAIDTQLDTFQAGGFVWQKVPPDKAMPWDEAKAYCATLALAGGGWKLPAQEQLEALFNSVYSGKPFMPGVLEKATYWSSSTVSYDTAIRKVYYFQGNGTLGDKVATPNRVRCVR